MLSANELIERMEKETGQELDVSDPHNVVVAGLLGALSRAMGQSPQSYGEQGDVVAGVMLRHQMTSAYQREQKSKEALVEVLLLSGLPPDDIAALSG